MLVAVIMLFVVGAMAALSIDVVTLYTARSEAQLAADGAALAGARVLANSGMTSAPSTAVGVNAAPIAISVATQVAASNLVGGRNLRTTGGCSATGEICVIIDPSAFNFIPNPKVTVQVQRTDLPTFFARIWGNTALAVKATATAEAYNPSSALLSAAIPGPPVAPICVKPLLLPNMDPSTGAPILDATTGNILIPTLLGAISSKPLVPACTGVGACNAGDGLTAWQYYPGADDAADFPAPNATSVVCPGCSGFNAYQLSIAGCVQPPIPCNAFVNIDNITLDNTNRDADTVAAVNDMTHSVANKGDSVDTLNAPSPPFQFLAGADNPVVQSGVLTANTPVMVSDSLVTVPVFDTASFGTFPTVHLIGFVQLFLNPTGAASLPGALQTQVINLVGCGTASPGQAILGNGSSPVVVRLISP